MKTKIEVKNIPDNDTEICVNSAEHRIDEIKKEFREFLPKMSEACKAEVLDLWEE